MSEKTNGTENGVSPYWTGDRVMRTDGRIGVVIYSGYSVPEDKDFGKKFVVRPDRKREVWKRDEIDPKWEIAANKVIGKLSGEDGLVAGVAGDDVIVWPMRGDNETWKIDDIAGLADEEIRRRALESVEQETERLAGERDSQNKEYNDLMNDYLQLAKTIPLGVQKVCTKLLVRSTIINGAASSKFTMLATNDLQDHLNAGWEILHADTHTIYNPSSEKIEMVEVYLLKWCEQADDDARLHQAVDDTQVDEPEPAPQWASVFTKGGQQAVKVERVQTGSSWQNQQTPVEDCDPAPREGSAFADALRDPDVPLEMLKAIGNAEALKAGKETFARRTINREEKTFFPKALPAAPAPPVMVVEGEVK